MIRFATTILLLLFSAISCYAVEMERTNITTPGGKKIAVGIASPAGDGPFPVVVLQRGNGGSLNQYEKALPRYAREGFLVIAIDYTVERDAVKFAATQIKEVISAVKLMPKAKADKIGIWGFSNGGAAVLYFASENTVQAIVTYGAASKRAAMTEKDISAPLLMMHGSSDSVVSVNDSKEYANKMKAIGKSVELKIFEGKGHSWDSDVMTESIAFFKETLR